MTHTLPGPLSDTSTTGPSAADAGNDASFAATVVEELFVDAEEGDSLPAVDTGDEALQMLPTLSHVGRYLLKHQLGSGGLGAVYAALDPLLSRQVAVKMLHVADLDTAERGVLESQLLAEARAAAGLAHPNIVTMYDAGLAPEGVYIAMERLQGKDVRQLLADGWRPDMVQAARIAKRLADALAYAHGKGVVHCDVKPANIFMVGRTQPKLLDFGIARVTRRRGRGGKALGEGDSDVVDIDTGSLGAAPAELGSPYYVSPEQLRGEELDARADVYGVGVVMYEMLTGQRAFAGASLDEIRHAVQDGEVPAAQVVNPKVDRALSDIVARAMARKPGDRFRSARQLSRALRTWISDETNGLVHKPPKRAWRTWGGWAWAAGGTLAIGFIAFVWLMKPQGQDAGEPVAAVPLNPRVTAPVAAPVAASPVVAATPAPAEAATPIIETAAPAPQPAKPRAEASRTVKKDKPPAKDKATPAAAEPTPAAAPAPGIVQLAVTPWGQVEVDGRAMGTTPPLARLSLPAGPHQIVVRNGDFPAHTTTVTVSEDKPLTLRHRFE
jgi:eukaryotic-like serine/threonine-protein kinase